MKNKFHRLLVLVLCLFLVNILTPGAAAAGEEDDILHISDVESFLAFAENCRLDVYSQGLRVSLDSDLDLTAVDFEPIPIFSGEFNGNGHTISGLKITRYGSTQGLFRYLTETAVVKKLVVKGDIHPQGSHDFVGGIAGENAGKILECRFTGTVSGGDSIGGIAGINTVTGIIEKCRVYGTVTGSHFTGGIAGENEGVVRSCSNSAAVNTTPQQNTVDINDITLETITNTESANTVTDIGGIAGISSGVIRDCVNRGDIGYRQMGYNIGGIAGTQNGYITGCENFGEIQGRKEVGGIVGQMEPVVLIEFTTDMLQVLREQLNGMSGIANQASAHTQSGASAMGTQIDILSGQVGEAADAVDKLLDDSGYIGGIPDPDTMQAIENTLASHMTGINSTLDNLSTAMENTMYSIAGDMQALAGQIGAMSETLDQAEETLGVEFIDVSDEDTPEQLSGKVEKCINNGAVLADMNAGGIAGAIAPENDMNGYEDLLFSGEESMNLVNEFRAVILSCDNKAIVTVNKQQGGGIAGWMSMGLVRNCMNRGTLDAENADYLGGIAGLSSGYIRSCYSSCSIYGDAYVGGIAGSGTVVSDCRSMISLVGTEKLGGIMGVAEEPAEASAESTEDAEEKPEPITENIYVFLDRDMGGIDGISYDGKAQPMDMDDFMELEDIPVEFGTVVVCFVCDDGTEQHISLATGGMLKENQIPDVPEKAGYTGVWNGIEKANLGRVITDYTFTADYTAKKPVIETVDTRDNGMPVLLAQGLFSGDQTVTIEPINSYPAMSVGEEWAESWEFAFPNGGEVTKLRLALPAGSASNAVRLLVKSEAGEWQPREFTAEGSYLVFEILDGDEAVCLINSPNILLLIMICVGAVVVVALSLVIRSRIRRKQ